MLFKLEALGAKPGSLSRKERDALLNKVESRFFPLPQRYRELLQHFGGDIEFDSLVEFRPDARSPWTSGNGTDAIELLYGLQSRHGLSVIEMFDRYAGRVPREWFPIGAAPGCRVTLRWIYASNSVP